MTILILLWILGVLVALALFFAPLGIWFGVDRLRDEARRTNELLEELIAALTEENPDPPDVSDPPARQEPAPPRPGRPVYEIKHP